MLAAAMVTYGLRQVVSAHHLAQWADAFRLARDVVFTRSDPLPFIGQFLTLGTFTWSGLCHGISPIEASTHDIEWNGDL